MYRLRAGNESKGEASHSGRGLGRYESEAGKRKKDNRDFPLPSAPTPA